MRFAAALANILCVSALLTVLGGWFVAMPEQAKISEVENRTLASLPSLTAKGLADGSYTRELEMYVADHFPGRDRFVTFAFFVRGFFGIRGSAVVYEARHGFDELDDRSRAADRPRVLVARATADTKPARADRGVRASHVSVSTSNASTPTNAAGVSAKTDVSPKPGVPATAEAPVNAAITETTDADSGAESVDARPPAILLKSRVTSGILITGGRGMYLFDGDDAGAKAYAAAVNAYVDAFGDKVTIHSVVAPTAVSFYLPEAEKDRSRSERENLAVINANLRSEVRAADIYAALLPHVSESIYLRTDHHWTALGAYYGYRAWCAAAGVQPVALETLERKVRPPKTGSFYRLTKDPTLHERADEIEYWLPSVSYEAFRYTGSDQKTPVKATFIDEDADGYLVFLGADPPLMTAHTSVKNGRRAVLIKNSFANAFAPFLLHHFEELIVVDYRYYRGNVADLVKTHDVTDIIILGATLTANSSVHARHLRYVIFSTGEKPPPFSQPTFRRGLRIRGFDG